MKFIWWLVGVTVSTRTRFAVAVEDVPHEGEDMIDDVAYPTDVLKRMERSGINVTGIPVAKEFQRVIQKKRKWWQVTSEGKVAVPWGFHKDFPDKPIFKKWFEELNKDLGCVELVFLEQKELEETKWENGILVTFDSKWDDCWTPFGMVAGSTGGKGQVTKYGVKPMWQLMRFCTECLRKASVDHMLLHALGFHHLQTRPDRDQFIDVDVDQVEMQKEAHNWRQLDWSIWQQSSFPFDHRSILMHSGEKGITATKTQAREL